MYVRINHKNLEYINGIVVVGYNEENIERLVKTDKRIRANRPTSKRRL